MLIASSSTIVGEMKSHAIARSDIPPRRNVSVDAADAKGTGVAWVISMLVATTGPSRSSTPAQRRRMHWRVPVSLDLVVEHAQGQRSSSHLERRGDIADQRARHPQPLALEALTCRVEQQVKLTERSSAKPVDEHEQLLAFGWLEVADDGFEQLAADCVSRCETGSATPRLPVDAHADFHFVVADVKRRRAGGWHDAARQGDSHRGRALDD